jgi:hypothetical protein
LGSESILSIIPSLSKTQGRKNVGNHSPSLKGKGQIALVDKKCFTICGGNKWLFWNVAADFESNFGINLEIRFPHNQVNTFGWACFTHQLLQCSSLLQRCKSPKMFS